MPPAKTTLTLEQLKQHLRPEQLSRVKKIEDGTEKVYCVGTRSKEKIENVKFYSVDSSGKSKNRLTIMINGECAGTKNPNKGNKPYRTTSILANVSKKDSSKSKSRKSSQKRRSKSRKSSQKRRSKSHKGSRKGSRRGSRKR